MVCINESSREPNRESFVYVSGGASLTGKGVAA